MKIIMPEHPVHQCYFECEECGAQGYVQTEKEQKFCPTCGNDQIQVDLIEFTLLEETIEETKPEIVYKEKIVYRNKPDPKTDRRFGYQGSGATPTLGHRGVRRDIQHKIVNTPPIITSVLGENGKRTYTVDCGYTGDRATVSWHLEGWHGMSHKEAKEAVKIKNHDWQDKRHRLLIHDCGHHGLHPVSVEFLGYIKSPEGERLYRYHVPECGFIGARTSLIRHLVKYHGYDRETAMKYTHVRGILGLADRTNVNKHLEEDPIYKT